MKERRAIRVMLVEDNPGDVDLVLEVLSASSPPHQITIAGDGVEALAKLNSTAELPDLVILDLNLPKKDGRELLRDLKTSERFRTIPVVVFSSSEADRDLRDAYDLHANCFVTKLRISTISSPQCGASTTSGRSSRSCRPARPYRRTRAAA